MQSNVHAASASTTTGAGDIYYPDYGNGGYDVIHYDIRLRYFPDTDRLIGTTTILATATQDVSAFSLDFILHTRSVRVNNRVASFDRQGDHELIVRPATPVAKGSRLTIVVQYDDVPSTVVASDITAWNRTVDGALAVNQPEIAWWWFPSNDHPTDKATFEVSVLVPNGIEAISNGVPTRWAQPAFSGWSRWSWRADAPQATYLSFLAIGDFEIRQGTSADGSPIITAYSTRLDADTAAAARTSVERTDEIIAWAAELFGPYPFNARGGVVTGAGDQYFALETQTRPVYDGYSFMLPNESLVVHELVHQWFGDSVSVDQWRDIWLNEGFATYAEWLWMEDQGQLTTDVMADFVSSVRYPADDPFWRVLPGDPGPTQLLHDAVYFRGALTLHYLRKLVGSRYFFVILRTWAQKYRYGNSNTAEFRALAEKISGQRLDEFFRTWLYTPMRPDLGPTSAETPAEPQSWSQIVAAHEAAHGQRFTRLRPR
ncbi:M1 family metallopeptidase [Paractinoplanes rishiriensis]|uniref:M1 family metallopeptidase n=1 Tax=Paractinoplanes rishiriensis TaxID=1050105 RepID=UPI001EF1A184|nr:M1 family metallopeptidase [Actinoplanes rishiriensis]